MGGYRFISYTTDFDCGVETPWWYVIKDEPIVIDDIPSSKIRYSIRRGLRFVTAERIDPRNYGEAMYQCYEKAQTRYKVHEGHVDKEAFLRNLETDHAEYYGVFFTETGLMVAYARNDVQGDCLSMTVIKYDPEYLKYNISSALTYTILCDYLNTGRCKYVSDGQRSVRHKTNIQDYLEHTFGFRKAYSRLNICYSPVMKLAVTFLYPFRKLIDKVAGENILLNNIASVLKMEEISRQCRKILKK
ncbi:MAG: hypothetical protein IKT58_05295 [Oscillospiraceae bacterium]|nr:hypothetical protein [Oscillospiraceae bacterium]